MARVFATSIHITTTGVRTGVDVNVPYLWVVWVEGRDVAELWCLHHIQLFVVESSHMCSLHLSLPLLESK